MQPCAVCGGVTVDQAGYCTQCRTFRGVPGQPPGYPPPQPYPGYPMSYPAAQPAPRRSFLIPLVALSATLFVLIAAIVIVVAVRSADDDPGTTPTSASDVDECVVGTWRVTSHQEDVPVKDYGKVTFTGGDGATLRLGADGTGETDYGSGTEFEGEMRGQDVRLEVSGTLKYRYTARDGHVTLSDIVSDASGKLFLDNEQYGDPLPFEGSEDPSTYTCSGDSLTQRTFLYTTEYTRTS